MEKWILSVVAIVFITVVLSFFLPEGKLNKYIKSFFGIVIIFIIIQPIIYLKKGELNIDFDNENVEVVFQKDYLEFVTSEKVLSWQENVKKILEEKGFNNTNISIEYTVDDLGQPKIQNITVDLKNSVFIYDAKHIDIIEDIIKPVCLYLSLEEEQVSVIE